MKSPHCFIDFLLYKKSHEISGSSILPHIEMCSWWLLLVPSHLNCPNKSRESCLYSIILIIAKPLQRLSQGVVIFRAATNHFPDSRVHGANIGPIWGRRDPGGPHVGPMNFAIWVSFENSFFEGALVYLEKGTLIEYVTVSFAHSIWNCFKLTHWLICLLQGLNWFVNPFL